MTALMILLALAGAAAGSFVALLAERLLRGEGFARGRSRCLSCQTRLRARDLVPLLSWPLLRGRCATCGARIPGILWQAEIAGAGLGALAAWTAPDPLQALAMALWSWSLLGLALADLRRYRLPDALVIAAAALGLAMALVDGRPLLDTLTGAALAGGAFWAVRQAYRWWAGRDGMGLGDVKLMAALGLATPARDLPLVVLLGTLAALTLAGLRAWRKGRPLHRVGRAPLGAALALAAIAVRAIGAL